MADPAAIPSPELEQMCANARRITQVCGYLGLGDPQVSQIAPLLIQYGHAHPFLAGDHDPDEDPFIWETEE